MKTNPVVIKHSFRGSFGKTLWKGFKVFGGSALAVIGVLMVLNSGGFRDIFWGLILAIGGGLSIYIFVSDMIEGSIIATISDEGINITDKPFIPWESVKKIEIIKDVLIPGSDDITITYICQSSEELRIANIDPGFSAYTLSDVMNILQEFQERSLIRNS